MACQALCVDSEHIKREMFEDENHDMLNALFSFVTVPEEEQLNSTLCGYFNKIISYWLIMKPQQMIRFISGHPTHMNDVVEHIYLNSSIIDTIIRICCVQKLDEEEQEMLNGTRSEILGTIINKLEHY